mmetsp:Transcript_31792/g.83634  ORF Transcript_31792/g.83634 Transcript_31792/m.83634 type:complete len:232 (-) Transcript_31792:361-1056(-)
MPVSVIAATLGGTQSTVKVDIGATVSELKGVLTENTTQELEDVDLVLGGTVLSDDLDIDELARGTQPKTRKRTKSSQTLCLTIVKRERPEPPKRAKPGPLLCKDALARFVAQNTSDRVVKVFIYGKYGGLFDERTLAVGASWTYARVRVDWREKSVLVRFASGDEVCNLTSDDEYLVVAKAVGSRAKPQEWCLAADDWKWDFAESLSESEDFLASEDESDENDEDDTGSND